MILIQTKNTLQKQTSAQCEGGYPPQPCSGLACKMASSRYAVPEDAMPINKRLLPRQHNRICVWFSFVCEARLSLVSISLYLLTRFPQCISCATPKKKTHSNTRQKSRKPEPGSTLQALSSRSSHSLRCSRSSIQQMWEIFHTAHKY